MTSLKKLSNRFLIIFSRLPQAERNLPIVKVDEKILTWNDIYREIKKEKSELKEKILKKLNKMGLI